MKRCAVATNAGADNEQIVVERFGRAAIGGERGRDCSGVRAAREVGVVAVERSRET